MIEIAAMTGVDAVCASSIFHYREIVARRELDSFAEEGNIEFLKSVQGGPGFLKSRLLPAGISEVKKSFRAAGLRCRDALQ
jgi:hypothetical protein